MQTEKIAQRIGLKILKYSKAKENQVRIGAGILGTFKPVYRVMIF